MSSTADEALVRIADAAERIADALERAHPLPMTTEQLRAYSDMFALMASTHKIQESPWRD